MAKDRAMETLIKRTIRSAMAEEDITYAELRQRLAANGIEQSESTLRSKVNNGTLATSMFIHILACCNHQGLDIQTLMRKYQRIREQTR